MTLPHKSYKVSIPYELTDRSIKYNVDQNNDYRVTLDYKVFYKPDLADWFVKYIGYRPTIMMSYSDFEQPGLWAEVPSQEIKTAFEVTWK